MLKEEQIAEVISMIILMLENMIDIIVMLLNSLMFPIELVMRIEKVMENQ